MGDAGACLPLLDQVGREESDDHDRSVCHHGDLHAVADRTFLRPTVAQERIAEAMHVSFSTYRRHRDRAVAHIVEWMWEREIYGPERERGHQMDTG